MRGSRIYVDFISSLKMFVRERSSTFWVLAFPVIIMLIFGAIFSQGNVTYDLYIQDKDTSDLSVGFINAINTTNAFKVHLVNSDADANAYIKANKLVGMLIIPQGFGTTVQNNLVQGRTPLALPIQANASNTTGLPSTAAGSSAPQSPAQSAQNNTATSNTSAAYVLLKIDQSQTTAPLLTGILRSVVDGFNQQLTGAQQVVTVQSEGIISSQFEYIDFFVPGIIGLNVLTTGVLSTVGINTKYRNNGILRKLATTPLRKYEWITSKIMYQTIIVFISAAITLTVATIVFGVQFIFNIYFVILLIVGSMTFTGIGMIIARFVHDEDAANAAASAVTFPMLFLAGTFFPLETMPTYLQALAKVLPLTYLNYGLRDAMILGDTASALYNTSILLVFGVVFFVIGSIITDWRED